MGNVCVPKCSCCIDKNELACNFKLIDDKWYLVMELPTRNRLQNLEEEEKKGEESEQEEVQKEKISRKMSDCLSANTAATLDRRSLKADISGPLNHVQEGLHNRRSREYMQQSSSYPNKSALLTPRIQSNHAFKNTAIKQVGLGRGKSPMTPTRSGQIRSPAERMFQMGPIIQSSRYEREDNENQIFALNAGAAMQGDVALNFSHEASEEDELLFDSLDQSKQTPPIEPTLCFVPKTREIDEPVPFDIKSFHMCGCPPPSEKLLQMVFVSPSLPFSPIDHNVLEPKALPHDLLLSDKQMHADREIYENFDQSLIVPLIPFCPIQFNLKEPLAFNEQSTGRGFQISIASVQDAKKNRSNKKKSPSNIMITVKQNSTVDGPDSDSEVVYLHYQGKDKAPKQEDSFDFDRDSLFPQFPFAPDDQTGCEPMAFEDILEAQSLQNTSDEQKTRCSQNLENQSRSVNVLKYSGYDKPPKCEQNLNFTKEAIMPILPFAPDESLDNQEPLPYQEKIVGTEQYCSSFYYIGFDKPPLIESDIDLENDCQKVMVPFAPDENFSQEPKSFHQEQPDTVNQSFKRKSRKERTALKSPTMKEEEKSENYDTISSQSSISNLGSKRQNNRKSRKQRSQLKSPEEIRDFDETADSPCDDAYALIYDGKDIAPKQEEPLDADTYYFMVPPLPFAPNDCEDLEPQPFLRDENDTRAQRIQNFEGKDSAPNFDDEIDDQESFQIPMSPFAPEDRNEIEPLPFDYLNLSENEQIHKDDKNPCAALSQDKKSRKKKKNRKGQDISTNEPNQAGEKKGDERTNLRFEFIGLDVAPNCDSDIDLHENFDLPKQPFAPDESTELEPVPFSDNNQQSLSSSKNGKRKTRKQRSKIKSPEQNQETEETSDYPDPDEINFDFNYKGKDIAPIPEDDYDFTQSVFEIPKQPFAPEDGLEKEPQAFLCERELTENFPKKEGNQASEFQNNPYEKTSAEDQLKALLKQGLVLLYRGRDVAPQPDAGFENDDDLKIPKIPFAPEDMKNCEPFPFGSNDDSVQEGKDLNKNNFRAAGTSQQSKRKNRKNKGNNQQSSGSQAQELEKGLGNFVEFEYLGKDIAPQGDENPIPDNEMRIPEMPFAPDEGPDREPQPFDKGNQNLDTEMSTDFDLEIPDEKEINSSKPFEQKKRKGRKNRKEKQSASEISHQKDKKEESEFKFEYEGLDIAPVCDSDIEDGRNFLIPICPFAPQDKTEKEPTAFTESKTQTLSPPTENKRKTRKQRSQIKSPEQKNEAGETDDDNTLEIQFVLNYTGLDIAPLHEQDIENDYDFRTPLFPFAPQDSGETEPQPFITGKNLDKGVSDAVKEDSIFKVNETQLKEFLSQGKVLLYEGKDIAPFIDSDLDNCQDFSIPDVPFAPNENISAEPLHFGSKQCGKEADQDLLEQNEGISEAAQAEPKSKRKNRKNKGKQVPNDAINIKQNPSGGQNEEEFEEFDYLGKDVVPQSDENPMPLDQIQVPEMPFAPESGLDIEPQPFQEATNKSQNKTNSNGYSLCFNYIDLDKAPASDCEMEVEKNYDTPKLPFAPSEEMTTEIQPFTDPFQGDFNQSPSKRKSRNARKENKDLENVIKEQQKLDEYSLVYVKCDVSPIQDDAINQDKDLKVPKLPFAPTQDDSIFQDPSHFNKGDFAEHMLNIYGDADGDSQPIPQNEEMFELPPLAESEEEEEEPENDDQCKNMEEEVKFDSDIESFDSADLSNEEINLREKPSLEEEEEKANEEFKENLQFLVKQQTVAKNSKKSQSQVENLVNSLMQNFLEKSKKVITEAMKKVNSWKYQQKKARINKKKGITDPIPDKYEFLDVMDVNQLGITLLSLLPIIKLSIDQNDNKYLIGAGTQTILIKADKLMIRVGGGYATLEEFIHQNGPFECIKIYKTQKAENLSYPAAVKYYLEKHKAANKVIVDYMKNASEDQLEFFSRTIDTLKTKQAEQNNKYQTEAKARASVKGRPSIVGGSQNAAAASSVDDGSQVKGMLAKHVIRQSLSPTADSSMQSSQNNVTKRSSIVSPKSKKSPPGMKSPQSQQSSGLKSSNSKTKK